MQVSRQERGAKTKEGVQFPFLKCSGDMEALRVGIVGGSIGGLAAATALHRLGAVVRVFEQSPVPFHGRGGSIGYCNVPLWEQLRGTRMTRRGQPASRAQGAFLYGDLWAFWADALPDGVITYGAKVESLGDDLDHPTINGETFDLAIVADGGWSSLRTRHFDDKPPEYAGYVGWRFRVETKHVPNFRAYGEYSNAHFFTILLDVAMNDGTDWIMGGTVKAAPEEEIVRPSNGAARQVAAVEETGPPSWFIPWYREVFGRHANGELSRVMEAAAAHGKISALPQFEYKARQVVKGRVVLLGDAAHMASPRTAAGAHTAVLDATDLYDAFAEAMGGRGEQCDEGWGSVVDQALGLYGPRGVQRAAALYARSREVGEAVVAPGWKRGGD